MTAHPAALDFSDLFARIAGAYERRPGAEGAVRAAIGTSRPGCVLVLGGPGSGKTMLAAHLIQSHGWCHHFLRAGHTSSTVWQDPYACLASIAFQLQAEFGDGIFPESVAIDAKGRVHDVGRSGTVTAVDIERLVALPWRREQVVVDLDARKIAGDVTGVRIGELVENYRSVPLAAFRDLALFEPLRRLRRLQPQAHVTIWIDGLDEDADASMRSDETQGSIASMLPAGSDCRELGNLTLVVSARRGRHLDRLIGDEATIVELDGAPLTADTRGVIATILARALEKADVRAALAELDWPLADVQQEVLEASDGSLLFVHQYVEALRHGFGAALRAGGLPRGLDEIHARILSTLLRAVPDARRADVLGVMEPLAVTAVPVPAAQLARFARISDAAARDALRDLQPLLEVIEEDGPARVAWYHKAVRDCLTDARHQEAAWHVDPERAHLRIASAYADADGSASNVDGYGLQFTAHHLAHGGAEGGRMLRALLHDGWRSFCREHTGSNRLFREALDLARRSAQALPAHQACLETMRLGLMDVYVRSAEAQVPVDALDIMARLGEVQRAIDCVADDLEPVEYARRHGAIIRGLLSRPGGDQGLAVGLLQQARQQLTARPDWRGRELREILDGWPLEAAEALTPILEALETDVLGASHTDAASLAAVARIRTRLKPHEANALFAAAFDAVMTEGATDGGTTLGRVLSEWGAFDAAAARAHLMARGTFRTDAAAAAGFLRLSRALDRQGSANAFVTGAQMLLDLPQAPDGDPIEYAGIWLEVARQGADVVSPSTAAAIVDRVQASLAHVRTARQGGTPGASLPPAGVALLVGIAEVERQCARGREAAALAEAWHEVLDGADARDEDLERLVILQSASDDDLLEAYLNSAQDALAPRLWFAVVRTGVLPTHPGGRAALERVVRAAERPKATGWSFLFHALAGAAPLDRLDDHEQLLRQVGVHESLILRWRVGIVRRLAAGGDVRAADWLRVTLQRWARSRPNPNFVEELPGTLAELPARLVEVATEMVAMPESRRQQRLLCAAIGRQVHADDPDAGLQWFARALDPGGTGSGGDGLHEYFVLAFTAGQLWGVDPARATAVWHDAVRQFEARLPADAADTGHARVRYVQHCAMVRALQWGAPEAALPALRALDAPPPEPGTRIIIMPFPSVSPFRVAGLEERDHLLGEVLVRAIGTNRTLVADALRAPLGTAARAFALAQLAQSPAVLLPQRLAWAQEATDAAASAEPDPLRWLLAAEAAVATAIAGARRRALEMARTVEAAVEPHLLQGDTMVAHAYAAAFGRCIRVAIAAEEWTSAWGWLWRARALGMHGFHVLLGEVAGAMVERGMAPDLFIDSEARGRHVYMT